MNNPNLWSAQRTYRPFIISSLFVALTLGFTTGAAILFFPLLGLNLGNAWPTHTQSHGTAQIFGWAGLFVMGIGFHVVPRIRNNPMSFPWPQRFVLSSMLIAIVTRFFGQTITSYDINDSLLAVSTACLALGLGSFALFIGITLLKGKTRHSSAELWIVVSLAWGIVAAGLDLMIIYRLIGSGSEIISTQINGALIEASLLGFISNFIFGISLRVIPSFLNLPSPKLNLNRCSLVCINIGIAMVVLTHTNDLSDWLLLVGEVIKSVGFLTYILSLRLYSRKKSPGKYIANIYGRFEWFLQVSFFWLLVGGLLEVWKSIGNTYSQFGPPVDLGAPAIHVVGLGFITIMIIGMSSRMLPMFEAAVSPKGSLMDTILVFINLSVLLRIISGTINFDLTWTGLALSGTLGTLSISLFGLVVWAVFRSSSSEKYVELTRYKTPLKIPTKNSN